MYEAISHLLSYLTSSCPLLRISVYNYAGPDGELRVTAPEDLSSHYQAQVLFLLTFLPL